MASQIARHIFKVPKVVTRVYDPIRQDTFAELGLETISPTVLGANAFMKALVGQGPE
jgi:trk system potassium uptake protein TrkA